ncbi:MAG: DUF493 domain-containing protein [Kiritimatiellaeota bacterium]|nr:DUF493 domain-containing protein [Kiritimatiellota bacterium]
MIRQKIIQQEDGNARELEYPAQFHFRVITDAVEGMETTLAEAVGTYEVTLPLARARASAGGRYTAYAVSILMRNREEMETFDATIRKIPGVRMLL